MARRRRRKGQPQVMRCDLLPSNLTASKEARVRELLRAWRKGAVLLGREQWRLFHGTGWFDLHEPDLLVLRLRGQGEVIRTPRGVREFVSIQALAAV